MKRIDVIILVVLLVAAAGSALGVVTYEDSRGTVFRVAWATTEETVEAEPQSLMGNGQVELALNVPVANVTGGNVTVDVGSNPGALAPIAVHIELTVPGISEPFVVDGELPTASTGASFVVPIELVALPNETTVRAAGPEAAEARLAETQQSTLGQGNWTIVVSLATTTPDPLGAVQHTVGATAVLQVYAPEVTVRSPEVSR